MRKVTVIIGGASGLGLAVARCMAAEYTLLLCDRSKENLEKAAQELYSFGADVLTYQLDAADKEQAKKCAEFAAAAGIVKNVIHTAGINSLYHTAEQVVHVNGTGPIATVEAFLPVMQEDGVMILFSSSAAYIFDTMPDLMGLRPLLNDMCKTWDAPEFEQNMLDFIYGTMQTPKDAVETASGLAYAISKYFVRTFVYANAWRFAKKGCRIISVSPGCYLTPMHREYLASAPQIPKQVVGGIPMGRQGNAYEMGKLIHFLCSPYAYIHGVDILSDGGNTFGEAFPQIP